MGMHIVPVIPPRSQNNTRHLVTQSQDHRFWSFHSGSAVLSSVSSYKEEWALMMPGEDERTEYPLQLYFSE